VSDVVAESDVREFTTSDGYKLHYRFHPPCETPPRGYVVALHGIQSHAGWYEYSSQRLADAGYEVAFLDRRGSGLNEQDRGHAPHADRLVNDVVQFLGEVRFRRKRDAPTTPVILSGVSWGGKLAAVTCARRPELVDALALLTPGICARVRPSWHQRWRLQLAGMLGVERKMVSIPLGDPAIFTDEPEWQQFIRDDRLSLRQATVSLLRASVELDDEVAMAPQRIDCPALLMLAGKDQIVDNDKSRQWFERLQSPKKQIIEYSDARHTLEFEPDRQQIIDDLIEWHSRIEAR
jgi:alpha-beta hydrolase superfamily lysophospholipase